ncbi:hypothetical protein JB92DRAFT_3085564 [Gautieria morchelliformis]|nr:hypothetical protein JB92DRAFT_3085564 [Gautieria morchelliformis]
MNSAHTPSVNKSISIIGAGSSGLAALKAVLDLPIENHQFWSVVYGYHPNPPILLSTPLYPNLHMNTPHLWMTCPEFPFPTVTPLYPSHEHIFGPGHYICRNPTVLKASWVEHGPKAVPDFPGSQTWLDNRPPGSLRRSILHSIIFRDSNDYVNRTVVVIGGGASGIDAALQLEPIAQKVYLSLKQNSTTFPINSSTLILKPYLSHFTRDGPVFINNTPAVDADALILAMGYELRIPFLDVGGVLRTGPSARSGNSTHGYTGLTTNLRYIFPLHDGLFSVLIISKLPPTALSFSLFVAHAIANDSLLPPHDDILAQLAKHEAVYPTDLESRGIDPYYVGHRLVGKGIGEDVQDRIIQFLKDKGAIPQDSHRYVETDAKRNAWLLERAWTRIESQGKVGDWLMLMCCGGDVSSYEFCIM